MGFLNGGVTFQRYQITGPRPRLFDDTHLLRLAEHQAGRQKLAAADGVETGWAAGAHIWDTDFTLEKNVYADHLLFDLWVQTDPLPADRLLAYYATDLKALAKDNPSGFASARQKREAKESARTRLAQEAKDGRYRKWKCVPCAWDAGTNALFFGATSLAHADRLEALWAATFQAGPDREGLAGGLSAVTPSALACARYPGAENEHLSPFVPGTTPEDRPYWCAAEGVPDFLGNEFLLWLWYLSDTAGDTIRTPDGSEITFMFSGGIKLDDPRAQAGDCTANSASAVRLPEARAAVRSGKLPREAALTVARNGDLFSFRLRAETLAVSGAKLPAIEDVKAQRDRELQRLQLVRDLAEAVDLLFGAFLARRMSGYWPHEVRDMGAWLKGGRVAA